MVSAEAMVEVSRAYQILVWVLHNNNRNQPGVCDTVPDGMYGNGGGSFYAVLHEAIAVRQLLHNIIGG